MSSSKINVYGIGGLGVDEQVFSKLKLNFDLRIVKWIDTKPKEDLKGYAKRIANHIDTSKPFIIIGVSFGGMMAIELAQILKPERIILISSAIAKRNVPLAFRLVGQLGLLKFTPDFLMKPPGFLAYYFFGVKDKAHKVMLKQIISETDLKFLRWAINKIVRWDNHYMPNDITWIHGERDRLLKYKNDDDLVLIPNAGHFMVVTHSDDVSNELNEIYESYSNM